jgi:hypothetical protein
MFLSYIFHHLSNVRSSYKELLVKIHSRQAFRMAFLNNALREPWLRMAHLSPPVKILLFLVKTDLLAPCLPKWLVNPCQTAYVFLNFLSTAFLKHQCKDKCPYQIQLSTSASLLALIKYHNINKQSYDNNKANSLANLLKCTILLLA